VGFDDWLLALHLLSAFALVGAITMFSIGFVILRGTDSPARVLALRPTMDVGEIVVGVGTVGTIVFGVWLAISLDDYQVWDLWVLLAIVGWAIATELGRRGGNAMKDVYAQAEELQGRGVTGASPELGAAVRASRAPVLHWGATAVTLLILVDMIWKPGA
jgi:hypothetical protein